MQQEEKDWLICKMRNGNFHYDTISYYFERDPIFVRKALIDYKFNFSRHYIPPRLLKDPELIIYRLQTKSITFKSLPIESRSIPEVCLVAVKLDGRNLKHVYKVNTFDISLAAVENNPRSLAYCCYEFQSNPQIVTAALRKSLAIVKYVTDTLRNDKKFLRSLPQEIDELKVASRRLARAGRNYIWFDDYLLNLTQPYLPPEIQQQILTWII